MRSACENKNHENLNHWNFCINLDLPTSGEDQIFEWPTQRLLISRTIETEAIKVHKHGEISPCCAVAIGELHGHGLVALACKIKTYENLFCGLFVQMCEICTYENFRYTVLLSLCQIALLTLAFLHSYNTCLAIYGSAWVKPILRNRCILSSWF